MRLTLARRLLSLLLICVSLAAQALPVGAQGTAGEVLVLRLRGTINPPAASYVAQGVAEAERSGANALVLIIDTPGGLDDSTRDIVQAIDNSGVPVIMFVAPRGARAASAGTFIGMAAHVLAMAPGTTIGSATPVSIGSGGEAQDLPEDLRNKIVNEAASYIRAHAELRGRNADWAERAVREGANLGATEAVQQNVADLVASDLNDLLAQTDGMQVTLADGRVVTLRTAEAPTREYGMNWATRVLHVITDPNIAFILMSLGTLGLFVELLNPGLIVPGVAGGVSLLLGLYALGTLNAFWGGIVLIVLALCLLIAEAVTPTYGVLGISGIIALVAGGLLLFIDAPPGVGVSPWVLWSIAGMAALVLVFFMGAVLRTRPRTPQPMGYAALVGESGVVKSPLRPSGYVLVRGERWKAHALDGEALAGEEVVVERAEPSQLWVRKKKGG